MPALGWIAVAIFVKAIRQAGQILHQLRCRHQTNRDTDYQQRNETKSQARFVGASLFTLFLFRFVCVRVARLLCQVCSTPFYSSTNDWTRRSWLRTTSGMKCASGDSIVKPLYCISSSGTRSGCSSGRSASRSVDKSLDRRLVAAAFAASVCLDATASVAATATFVRCSRCGISGMPTTTTPIEESEPAIVVSPRIRWRRAKFCCWCCYSLCL